MRLWGADAKIRTRILWSIIGVAVSAVLVCGVSVFVLQTNSVYSQMTSELQSIEGELKVLAETGVDPQTGQPFADPAAVIRTHLERSVLQQSESEMGYVGANLTWLAPLDVTFRPEQDAELLSDVAQWVQATESTIRTVSTTSGTYRVLVAPVHSGSSSGALVHVYDVNSALAGLRSMLWTYAIVGIFTIALVAALAHLLVGRLLRPIGELRDATESIDETDLTKRVPVRSRDDLGRLAASFNRMLDRVQEASDAQRALLDDVGHELRTPVTILRGHLELIDPTDEDDVRQTRDLLLDETQRMGMLVEDILMLAKAQQADFVTATDVDLEVLGEQVFEKARALGDRAWVADLHAVGQSRLDASRVTQAWLQLVDNAVKYSRPASTITVGSRIVDNVIELSVRDEGIGISPEDLDRITQRFARSRQAARMAGGSGLGLSIVETIVVAHGGVLAVTSQPGIGSTFTLRLPVVHAPDPDTPDTSTASSKPTPSKERQ
ncbi:sensor histidine kinase [Schaalia suimastitidis]|uniref:sensor histidine kinase n=1 Tax=Schaalia suimastitidis TaxID=121163 RepID=UPI001F0B482A|nr:HAMP domain-containing sensor histidine kinase [Schaalia suimastitidis]